MSLVGRGVLPASFLESARRVRSMRVPGGGMIAVGVRAGDELRIVDPEGLQPGLLYAISEKEGAQAVIPAFDQHGAPTLDMALAAAKDGKPAAANAVATRGIAAEDVRGARLLGQEAPGAEVRFDIRANGLLLVFAPGEDMAPDAQNPATELLVEVAHDQGKLDPPAPLAEPKLDLRVDAATASAYRVKAGDYIHIIDVEGRQCSDFLAFDAAALEKGFENGLDATTTHSLMGTAAPGPGLHSKYFDQTQKPLVEVVQDTVGRHDTFMLACNAKYYEDMGYPGHSNCTDNFNHCLEPYGITPRKGWPAINFFYNTFVDDNDAIGLDEPWSRPGDYVLLRALTDLVCASSSCADDIDPANGWLPTDIHVRVYDKDNSFRKGKAHRMTPDAQPRMTRESGFYPRFAELTRKFEDYRGFWLPTSFSDVEPIEEYWACREKAVIMDLSALRKFEVTGPDSEELLQLAATRNVRKLSQGQVVYTAFCYEHGGMIDDGTIFRLGQNNFRVVCGDDYLGIWLREIAKQRGLKVWVRSSTDQLHNLALQGPNSRDILKEVVWTPPHQPTIAELKWFRFTIGRIAEQPVVISRTGYTGELGFEIWCHPDAALKVFDAIWEAGKPFGLRPFGLFALDMVRIEAGLVFVGYEFCDQTDPFEAGIGFTVRKEIEEEPFIGSEALIRRKANPQKKLVGLDIDSNDCVHHGDPVCMGRAQVGVVTSSMRSPILKKNIALARLDVTKSELGTEVEIGKLDGHQKRIPAKVVGFPHYDPQKTRVRA
jgi:aminomethyltransferase